MAAIFRTNLAAIHLTVRPDAIFDFVRAKGFDLVKFRTVGLGMGNNEFVFARQFD